MPYPASQSRLRSLRTSCIGLVFAFAVAQADDSSNELHSVGGSDVEAITGSGSRAITGSGAPSPAVATARSPVESCDYR